MKQGKLSFGGTAQKNQPTLQSMFAAGSKPKGEEKKEKEAEPVLSQKSEKKEIPEKPSQESKKRGYSSINQDQAADEPPVEKKRLKRTADLIEEESKTPVKP